jgi:tripartite-type tricarboxylate transporter receptor subunit TctC
VVIVHPSLAARNLKEFIALAKARPGQINMASAGTGTSNHLTGQYFQNVTGTKLVHVPYKGSGPALVDVMGGQVECMFDQLSSSSGYIKGGKLRALAVTTLKRSPTIPDVPTVDESGYKGFEASTTSGIMLPAATPQDIVMKVHAAVVRTVRLPATKEAFARIGADTLESTPEEFSRVLQAEIVKWTKVIKDANIKLE